VAVHVEQGAEGGGGLRKDTEMEEKGASQGE
jgi:hypothetical protein